MSLVTVTSAKGSPGATTLALSLTRDLTGAFAPADVCLVDADPDGGDVALLLGLDPVPGLATLALAGRHGLDRALVREHAQRPSALEGAAVLPGLSGRAQASPLEWLAGPLADAAASPGIHFVVDAGRAACVASLSSLFTRADVVILVCRSDTASVVHARSGLLALRQQGVAASCVVFGGTKDSADELAAALGAPVAALLPLAPPGSRRRAPGCRLGASSLASFVTGDRGPAASPPAVVGEHAPEHVQLAAISARTRQVSS